MTQLDNRKVFVVLTTSDMNKASDVCENLNKDKPAFGISFRKLMINLLTSKIGKLPKSIDTSFRASAHLTIVDFNRLMRECESRTDVDFMSLPSQSFLSRSFSSHDELIDFFMNFVIQNRGSATMLNIVLQSPEVAKTTGSVLLVNLPTLLVNELQLRFVNTFTFGDGDNAQDIVNYVHEQVKIRMPTAKLI